MKTPDEIRLENKLKLFEVAGFFQFLEDLETKMRNNPFIVLPALAKMVQTDYQQLLKEIQGNKSKYKQTKLPFNDTENKG